jgi:hypothetical protein
MKRNFNLILFILIIYMSSAIKILNATDPRASYVCGSSGKTTDLDTHYIPTDGMDYTIGKLEPEPQLEPEPEDDVIGLMKGELPDTRKNLSYLQVKSVEEGVEWYRKLDPKIPDDLLSLMSRWSFGDLSKVTKKDIKNKRRKAKKKGEKDPYFGKITIDKGEHIVKFD